MVGTIFDIQEFAVNDGPGLRTCVFMKGCPLRCQWCHNPEGLSMLPQKNLVSNRIVGAEWSVERLMKRLEYLPGGVTFSGGEATSQADFVVEAARRLRGIGKTVGIETCGYCASDIFQRIISQMDFVYYDLKCMDSALHLKMTGVRNDLILSNANLLKLSNVPFRFRVPLVPGISDTDENRKATLDFVGDAPVEWLQFNDIASAKYAAYGMKYQFVDGEIYE